MNDTGVQISPYDHKQSLHLCKESILHCQWGSEHSNICFWKIQHLVFLSQMTELKSVDYLQIFLSPPKLFIFLYLLEFLSCPVTLYTSMNSAHSVFSCLFFHQVLPIFCPSVTFCAVSLVWKKNQCTLLSWNCIYDLNRWLQFNFVVWPYHSLWLHFSSFQFFPPMQEYCSRFLPLTSHKDTYIKFLWEIFYCVVIFRPWFCYSTLSFR